MNKYSIGNLFDHFGAEMIKIREEPKKFISSGFIYDTVYKLLPTEEELISYVSKRTNGYIIDAVGIFSSPVNCLFGMYKTKKNNMRYLISLCLLCGKEFSHKQDVVERTRQEHIFKHIYPFNYSIGFRGGAIKSIKNVVPCYKPLKDEMGNDAPEYIRELIFQRENDFRCPFCDNTYGVVPTDDIIVSHLFICIDVKNESQKWDKNSKIKIIE